MAENAVVHNSTITGGSTGVSAGADINYAKIEKVTVNKASPGLDTYKANGTMWNHNEATGYTNAGMHVDGAENVTVRRTNFEDTNGTALEVENTDTTVDARYNWWGCPDGPDDAACDDVVGDAMVEPWLAEENVEAGAGT